MNAEVFKAFEAIDNTFEAHEYQKMYLYSISKFRQKFVNSSNFLLNYADDLLTEFFLVVQNVQKRLRENTKSKKQKTSYIITSFIHRLKDLFFQFNTPVRLPSQRRKNPYLNERIKEIQAGSAITVDIYNAPIATVSKECDYFHNMVEIVKVIREREEFKMRYSVYAKRYQKIRNVSIDEYRKKRQELKKAIRKLANDKNVRVSKIDRQVMKILYPEIYYGFKLLRKFVGIKLLRTFLNCYGYNLNWKQTVDIFSFRVSFIPYINVISALFELFFKVIDMSMDLVFAAPPVITSAYFLYKNRQAIKTSQQKEVVYRELKQSYKNAKLLQKLCSMR